MVSISTHGRQTSNELQPLNSTSTGHAGDLGDAQTPGGGPRRSSHLDLPRDPILGRLSCLNLPRDSISRKLSCLSHLGICTLTQECLALRLRQYWVEQASESLLVFFFSFSSLLLLT